MRPSRLAITSIAFALGLPMAAALAETPAPGRYIVAEMPIPGGPAGSKQTVMIDTEYGRSWVLVDDKGAMIWKRIYFDADSQPPKGQLRRPAPVVTSNN